MYGGSWNALLSIFTREIEIAVGSFIERYAIGVASTEHWVCLFNTDERNKRTTLICMPALELKVRTWMRANTCVWKRCSAKLYILANNTLLHKLPADSTIQQ